MSQVSQLFDLTGRVAVITGGAGLLGEQFCRTLAEAGAQVLIADANVGAAQDVQRRLTKQGWAALAVEVDVSAPGSVQGMVEKAVQRWGRLDVLVNSAALDPKFDPQAREIAPSGAFEDYPLGAWQQALDVNLTGVFLCCQAAARQMLAQGGGVIVNVASMYGVVAPDQRLYARDAEQAAPDQRLYARDAEQAAPDQRLYGRDAEQARFKPVYYTVTKAGVLGMTKYLAAYYAGKHIRVNALTPGGVYNGHDDEFVRKYSARAVLGRMANKDEMNGALLFLASDASTYMTGANLIVDGGWSAW